VGAKKVFPVSDLGLIYSFVVLLTFVSQVLVSAVGHQLAMWFRLDLTNAVHDIKFYGVRGLPSLILEVGCPPHRFLTVYVVTELRHYLEGFRLLYLQQKF
jgi:hypothetical protein